MPAPQTTGNSATAKNKRFKKQIQIKRFVNFLLPGRVFPAGFFIIMMSESAYNASLATLYSLGKFGIKLGLSTIKGMLRGLGNPQKGFKSIHVAGTNGKGSIASTLSSILASSGKKVGLYTSPHLVRFNERICINNTTDFGSRCGCRLRGRQNELSGITLNPPF